MGEKDMWKKIFCFLLLSIFLTACHFEPQTTEKIPNLNPHNETGWTVLHGIYVKTESGYDVFTFETRNNENEYIFMTFAEGCDTPSTLQTGDEIAIKIVLLQEINGVNTTQVFEWAEYGDSPVSVDSEVISEIERLSQQLTQTP